MRAYSLMLVSVLVLAISLSCRADLGPAHTAPVALLSIKPTDATIQAGSSLWLLAIARDSSGDTLSGRAATWSTSASHIASVGPTGIVSGVTPGSAQVFATVAGKSDQTTITVTSSPLPPTLAVVLLTPASIALQGGATQQFAASGLMSDGSTTTVNVTYSATGGTIMASGLYTAGVSFGAYRVIAVHTGSSLADTSTVTIVPAAPVTLAMVTQPGGATSGTAFAQQPVVELRNGQNQPVTQAGVVVTANKATGSGILGGTLTATTNSQGRASFGALTISGSGLHTLDFTAPNLTKATSQEFGVTAAPSLAFLGDFENGFSGWNTTEQCCIYSHGLVSSPLRSGSQALRIELRRTDPPLAGGVRSEILAYPGSIPTTERTAIGGVGDEVWWGMSIYIPGDWATDALPEIVSQIHEQPDACESWRASPWALHVNGGNWEVWSRWDDAPCTVGGYPVGKQNILHTAPVIKGKWTDWVFHAKWSYQSDGLLEAWRDGSKVLTHNGPNYYNDQRTGYLKVGLYKWLWNDPNTPTTVQTRVLYYDEVRIADESGSYAAVAPR